MSNKSVRIILVLAAIVLALFVVSAVLKNWYPLKNIIKPPQSAYPPGTKIDNPITVPNEFPVGIVNAGLTLTHIDTVNYPNGKEDITLAYNSTKTIGELLKFYSDLLKSKGWKIQTNQETANSGVILAVDPSNNKLFVTIVANSDGTSRVTFLYKK